ncbi:hypothetical protein [Nocardia vinacea]|uniref:hypothetical protein n=1 Tax=Nocardia vinacea TaxID=96468 RepID=UPI003AF2C008
MTRVRAEHIPQVFVAPLADEVQVQLADDGQEALAVCADLRRLRATRQVGGSQGGVGMVASGPVFTRWVGG